MFDKKREISKNRIASLETNYNIKINVCDLNHMKCDNFLDLSKAVSWQETVVAERITKDPRKQSLDENNQLIQLRECFLKLEKCIPNTVFLVKGSFVFDKNLISEPDPADIDASLQDCGYYIGFTLKGGQNCDGGAQTKQFREIVECINNAPEKTSSAKQIFAIYVSGDFWTKLRSVFLGYEKQIKSPFNLVSLFEKLSENKKCRVFTDANLPITNVSFYEYFIKGYCE